MTDLLEHAVDVARNLPPDLQDEIARAVLALAGVGTPAYDLSPEEKASLAPSLAQSRRGEYASDEEVRAVWAKHGM